MSTQHDEPLRKQPNWNLLEHADPRTLVQLRRCCRSFKKLIDGRFGERLPKTRVFLNVYFGDDSTEFEVSIEDKNSTATTRQRIKGLLFQFNVSSCLDDEFVMVKDSVYLYLWVWNQSI